MVIREWNLLYWEDWELIVIVIGNGKDWGAVMWVSSWSRVEEKIIGGEEVKVLSDNILDGLFMWIWKLIENYGRNRVWDVVRKLGIKIFKEWGGGRLVCRLSIVVGKESVVVWCYKI